MEYKDYESGKDAFIDDLKDEIDYLKQKMKKYKCNEETIEREMEAITSENEILTRKLNKTKKELEDAREIIEETENHENMEIEELEMKQNIATKIIEKLKNDIREHESLQEDNKNLKMEMTKLKEEKDAVRYNLNLQKKEIIEFEIKHKEDISNLKDEINGLQLITEDKDLCIKSLSEENKMLQEKLENFEFKTIDKFASKNNADVVINPETDDNPFNLYEELNFSKGNNKFAEKFVCKSCGRNFENIKIFNKHSKGCHQKYQLDQHIFELRRLISNQTEHLIRKIFDVRENEIVRSYSCNSDCTVGCRIFHQKHDWVKPSSGNMFEKLKQIRSAEKDRRELCDQSLETFADFDKHIRNSHCFKNSRNSMERTTDLKTHLLTTQPDDQEVESDVSKSLISKSVSNSNFENVDKSTEDLERSEEEIKHLCNVCLLSFKKGTDLKQHIKKHTSNKKPSILKFGDLIPSCVN